MAVQTKGNGKRLTLWEIDNFFENTWPVGNCQSDSVKYVFMDIGSEARLLMSAVAPDMRHQACCLDCRMLITLTILTR